MLCVGSLIQHLPILSSPVRDTRSKSMPRFLNWVRSSVANTTAAMSPVGIRYILDHEPAFEANGCWPADRAQPPLARTKVTSFDVQLLSESRLANGPWKCQAVDLLVVVVMPIGLPVFIQIEAIDSGGLVLVRFGQKAVIVASWLNVVVMERWTWLELESTVVLEDAL